MANEIISYTREDQLPALHVVEIDRDLHGVVMCWEGGGGVGSGTPVLRRPFSTSEQSALERRVRELQCAVAPFENKNRDEVLHAINAMLGAFMMMQRYDQPTALGVAAGYLWTAQQQKRPTRAIIKTCEMVRFGSAGLNPKYPPNEPEWSILIGQLVEPYISALRRTERLMTSKIAAPLPPKLTREEIEAKLGHPLGTPSSEAKAPPVPVGDGKHTQRVFAELAARKARREANPEQITQNLSPVSQ
jgi:hypothetical protein